MAESLAGYLLEERIAVGGMAEVYRARRRGPEGFDKQVALKRVLPDLSRDPRFVQMFIEEARLAAALSCRNLVQVFDFGEAAGCFYLVMEHVDGTDLNCLLQRAGRLSLEAATHVGLELCEALTAVHNACDATGAPLGIVHRDVTPSNVLLSMQGEVKLGDFGVAKARARALRTADGTIKGKLAYLSPEQARGDEVDARTDLYGLGLLVFEVLTGERYLAADSDAALVRLAERPPPRQASLLAPLPAAVDAVLARALAVEPERRYPSAAAMAEGIHSWLASYDPLRAKQELSRLVARARHGESVAAAKNEAAAQGLAAKIEAAPVPAPMIPATHRTEVRDMLAPRGLGRLGWAALAIAVGGGALWASGVLTPAAPPLAPAPPSPLPVLPAPQPEAPNAEPPAPWKRPAARSRASPTARADAPQDSGVAATAPMEQRPAITVPQPVAEPSARDSLASMAASVEATLAERGLLPDDVPRITSALRRLTSAAPDTERPLEAVHELQQQALAVQIDRAFIDTKLQRLGKEIAARDLAPEVKATIRRHSQSALSRAVSSRYDDANRELNEIARLLEP